MRDASGGHEQCARPPDRELDSGEAVTRICSGCLGACSAILPCIGAVQNCFGPRSSPAVFDFNSLVLS